MDFRKMIDHTLLKPEATREQIEKICEEAIENGFKAVCVNPCWVELCSNMLKGKGVEIATVIGFPLGASTTEVKSFETKDAISKGATEIDMVVNIGALKSGDKDYVLADIEAVVKAAGQRTVKVIFETSLLNDDEIVELCKMSTRAGAGFVKTSTGFGSEGAKVHHVKLMKNNIDSKMEVKASGGIRDRETAIKMIDAGATRLGTSSGTALIGKIG